MATEKLSPTDWVVAGFKALQKGGPQAVRVESIAKTLNVSKGSFYWHFKGAGDLKHSMLKYWVEVATTSIIKEVDEGLTDPAQTLHYLARVSSANLGDNSHSMLADEASIRDWARYDADVAKVIKSVDKMRLEYVAKGFEHAGFKPATAKRKAKTLYAALIGLDYLAKHGMADMNEDLYTVLDSLLESKPS